MASAAHARSDEAGSYPGADPVRLPLTPAQEVFAWQAAHLVHQWRGKGRDFNEEWARDEPEALKSLAAASALVPAANEYAARVLSDVRPEHPELRVSFAHVLKVALAVSLVVGLGRFLWLEAREASFALHEPPAQADTNSG